MDFTYDTIDPSALRSTDLRGIALRPATRCHAFELLIHDMDGTGRMRTAEVLYLPATGRLGIASGGNAEWGDVGSYPDGAPIDVARWHVTPILDAIRTWLDDPEAWAARGQECPHGASGRPAAAPGARVGLGRGNMDETEIPEGLRAYVEKHERTLFAVRDALGLGYADRGPVDCVAVTALMRDGVLVWRVSDDTEGTYCASVLDAAHALCDWWGLGDDPL